MTYNYAVRRGALLLKRTLTHAKALRVAQKWPGSVIVIETFIKGDK